MKNPHTPMTIHPATPAATGASTLVLVGLACVLLLTVALRVPGLGWLLGIGPTADFSFMTDDQRFVDLAKDLRAGMPDG